MSDDYADAVMARAFDRQAAEATRKDRVRAAAEAYVWNLPDPDLHGWAENFGEWCADRHGYDVSWDSGTGKWEEDRMPALSRAWKAFYASPVDYGDEAEDDDAE